MDENVAIFQTCSTRLIAGVWYIFGLCILILYGIGLNSHVRSQVSGSRSQYTNLRQIINDPDIKLGVYCCGSTQAFLNVRLLSSLLLAKACTKNSP